MDSVAQLLASGTVGDGETNGYYYLVIVVIALLGKKKNTTQWACNETMRKNVRQPLERSRTEPISVQGPLKEKEEKMYFSFISHIKIYLPGNHSLCLSK